MQRKIISLILVLLLCAPLIETASADNSGLCFTATNDTLLELGSMPITANGTVYVPGSIFAKPFGVYYNYFDARSTAMLYNSYKQIYFDLYNGNCTDSNGTTYSASAVYKKGQVYVPLAWICWYFNLDYSYKNGNGYGDLLRIVNGNEVLTNQQFFDAAASLMQSRYNDYFGVNTSVTTTPSPSTPNSSGNNTGTPKSGSISLSFVGIPTANFLNILDSYSLKACFFVTADDANNSPDIIRRICGTGHSIGIYCKSSVKSECDDAVTAIFEAAQKRPILITSPDSIAGNCSDYAKLNGFSYFKPKIEITGSLKYAYAVTSKLENNNGYISLLLNSDTSAEKLLPTILQYINSNGFSVLPLRETNI